MMLDDDAECTFRDATDEEALAMFAQHGCIHMAVPVMRRLGVSGAVLATLQGAQPKNDAAVKHAVHILYLLGFGLEAIEDWFGLTTREVRRLVNSLKIPLIRLLYSAGLTNSAIVDWTGSSLTLVVRETKDLAKVPRGEQAREERSRREAERRQAQNARGAVRRQKAAERRALVLAARAMRALQLAKQETGNMKTTITDEQKTTILAELDSGKSVAEVAQAAGVSRGTVNRLRARERPAAPKAPRTKRTRTRAAKPATPAPTTRTSKTTDALRGLLEASVEDGRFDLARLALDQLEGPRRDSPSPSSNQRTGPAISMTDDASPRTPA